MDGQKKGAFFPSFVYNACLDKKWLQNVLREGTILLRLCLYFINMKRGQ